MRALSTTSLELVAAGEEQSGWSVRPCSAQLVVRLNAAATDLVDKATDPLLMELLLKRVPESEVIGPYAQLQSVWNKREKRFVASVDYTIHRREDGGPGQFVVKMSQAPLIGIAAAFKTISRFRVPPTQ